MIFIRYAFHLVKNAEQLFKIVVIILSLKRKMKHPNTVPYYCPKDPMHSLSTLVLIQMFQDYVKPPLQEGLGLNSSAVREFGGEVDDNSM